MGFQMVSRLSSLGGAFILLSFTMDGVSNYASVLRSKRKKRAYFSTKGRPFTAKRARKVYKKAKAAKRLMPVLSSCAVDYLKSQYNPWALNRSPCIPDFLQMPSFKQMTRIRGTFNTDSTGFGFIYMNPYLPTGSNGLTGLATNPWFLAPVWCSSGVDLPTSGVPNLLAATNPSGSATAPVGMLPLYWNSSLTTDRISNNLNGAQSVVAWRPVGGGIKVKHSGRVDERSGTFVLWEDPSNNDTLWSLSGGAVGSVAPSLLQREEANFTAITESEVAVMHHQKNMHDLEYSDNWYMVQGTNSLTPGGECARYHTLAIIVVGARPATSFAFDCVCHWEFVGAEYPSRTASHSDVVGMQKVQNTFPTQASVQTPEVQEREAKSKVVQGMKEAFARGVSYVQPFAREAAESYAPGLGIMVDTAGEMFGHRG